MGRVRVRGLSKELPFRGKGDSLVSVLRQSLVGAPSGHSFWALRDVDFEIHPGELLGVVGPNGSGKTTLLKILSRIYDATEGEVVVEGRSVPLLQIGAGFHLDLTGRDNVFANAALLGVERRRIHQLFDAIVDFSGIETYIDVPVKYYSSGMFVRLAFAIAVHSDPEVILTDEILAVGDIAFQAKCLEKFNHLREGGVCGIFVSHIPAMVLQFCKNALFLQHGRVQARGEAREVVDRYISSSVEAPAPETGAVRVGEIRFDSAEGPERVQWGRATSCEIRLECLEEIPDAAVDLGLFSMMWGNPISWSTSQVGDPALRLSKGHHSFRWEIDDLLVWPGTYYLQIRVRSGEREIIPWVSRRPVVVMPSPKENADILLHAQQGALYPRHRWVHRAEGGTPR